MPQIPYKEGGDWPELPARTPLLTKVIESEFKTEKNSFFGKPTGRKDKDGEDILDDRPEREVVKVVMEVVEGDYTGRRIWKTFTASISEKSNLRPFIQAAADHELTLEELKAFDTDDLVGRRLLVSGSYDEKDQEHKFLRPDSYMRVQATAAKAAAKPVAKTAAKAAEKPAAKAEPKQSPRDAAIAALKAKQAAELAALDAEGESGESIEAQDGEFDPEAIAF
jgi:pyruvate/2-oxoglutarate dehydrogenase complex dihydrolipoamide acyltransferase (E2) component